MVGSLDEAVASKRYGIVLFNAEHPVCDGKTSDERLVQIKVIQSVKVGIDEESDYMIVLRVEWDGSFEEVFNGPGRIAWGSAEC